MESQAVGGNPSRMPMAIAKAPNEYSVYYKEGYGFSPMFTPGYPQRNQGKRGGYAHGSGWKRQIKFPLSIMPSCVIWSIDMFFE